MQDLSRKDRTVVQGYCDFEGIFDNMVVRDDQARRIESAVERGQSVAAEGDALDQVRGLRDVPSGRLRINAARGQASLGERALKLERRPLLMLQLLAGRTGEVVTRAEILDQVWGSSYSGFEHSLEQAAHEIRSALAEPGWIETVRGIGYRFVTKD